VEVFHILTAIYHKYLELLEISPALASRLRTLQVPEYRNDLDAFLPRCVSLDTLWYHGTRKRFRVILQRLPQPLHSLRTLRVHFTKQWPVDVVLVGLMVEKLPGLRSVTFFYSGFMKKARTLWDESAFGGVVVEEQCADLYSWI